MDARHQAFRVVLLRRAEQAWLREADGDKRLTYQDMIESLQSGRMVWEDVCMFVVELSARKVSVNVILGVMSMGTLTVSNFAGENGNVYRRLDGRPLAGMYAIVDCGLLSAGEEGSATIWLYALATITSW